jgi:hypothetical protein
MLNTRDIVNDRLSHKRGVLGKSFFALNYFPLAKTPRAYCMAAEKLPSLEAVPERHAPFYESKKIHATPEAASDGYAPFSG